MSIALINPPVRKKSKWQALKTFIYYKWHYYVWYYVLLYSKIVRMFLLREKDLYYVYDLHIHKADGTITSLFELTWRNYKQHMSVDFGEYALLKFPNQNGRITLVTGDYFGNRKVTSKSKYGIYRTQH